MGTDLTDDELEAFEREAATQISQPVKSPISCVNVLRLVSEVRRRRNSERGELAGETETPLAPARREIIPVSTHATGSLLRISSSPTRSTRPISVSVKEPDGTEWIVRKVTIDGVVSDSPYPACRGNCWIDLEVECPHDHPPTEAAPVELRGVVLCEPSDLPVSAGDSERDQQWAKDFGKPYGAKKLPNGEWEPTFRGDASRITKDN